MLTQVLTLWLSGFNCDAQLSSPCWHTLVGTSWWINPLTATIWVPSRGTIYIFRDSYCNQTYCHLSLILKKISMNSNFKMHTIVCFLFQMCVKPSNYRLIIKENISSFDSHNADTLPCIIASPETSLFLLKFSYISCTISHQFHIYTKKDKLKLNKT